ncbi:MAG TPA: M23 family peptidase [Dysgonomonas sp.]|nr:M23 family peptidase [Dysgonomonas sp.]
MAKKKVKNRHSFWKRLNFKYRLSILNENTLDETWKLRVSMFNGIVMFFGFFLLLMIITSIIIITTPIRNYLPGYLDSEIREQAISAAIQVDSLETKQRYQEVYIQNILDIFEGKVDSIPMSGVDTIRIAANDRSLQNTERELRFRERFEEEEKYNLATSPSDISMTEGVTFFRPVRGVISDRFNIPMKHYGVTIVISGETVVATLEGSVVYTGYDAENGYVIQIQHKNGFISLYKGVTMLLKKTGDSVRTGEAIALMGVEKEKNNDKRTSLQFELWYRGNPVNPELYITF